MLRLPNEANAMHLNEAQKKLLRQVSLFADLPERSFDKVIEQSKVIKLPAAKCLFEQGQAVTDFFFVSAGQLKLTRLSAEGDEKVIEIINEGDSFAEAAVFGDFPGYPVNCFAIRDSVIFRINADVYKSELRSSMDSCFAMMMTLSMRTHRLLSEIDRLTLHNATHRLGIYLLKGVDVKEGSVDIDLNAPKHVIASRLSVKPETLSRTFKSLVKSNHITIKEKHILIHDIAEFRKLITLG